MLIRGRIAGLPFIPKFKGVGGVVLFDAGFGGVVAVELYFGGGHEAFA